MREMLPNAVEESRTPANSESVDDALLFIKDALEKFHLMSGMLRTKSPSAVKSPWTSC